MHKAFPKIYLYRRIVQAKLFIDSHYAEPIHLDSMAGEAYFSKYHFIRLFRKTYGKTPHQYLTHVRIEQAKLYLQGEMSVTEVCFESGFESVTSFTGLFKRIIGLTPSAYQAQQHHLQREIKSTPLKFIPHCFAEKKGWV